MKTRSGRAPSQREDEIVPFIELLLERGIRSYLEVGARHGDTFHQIMTSLPKGSRGVALDLPGGAWGQKKSRDSLDRAAVDLQINGYDVVVVYGDSTEQDVIATIEDLGPFDAVFIDGDHSLAGVTADWENYRHLAPLIAFHDIDGSGMSERGTGSPVEVPLLWAELRGRYETIEFIGAERGMGIGVVLR